MDWQQSQCKTLPDWFDKQDLVMFSGLQEVLSMFRPPESAKMKDYGEKRQESIEFRHHQYLLGGTGRYHPTGVRQMKAKSNSYLNGDESSQNKHGEPCSDKSLVNTN